MSPTPAPLPDTAEAAHLEQVAISLAREAAELIARHRSAELDPRTKSSATDVVTVMDTRSEALLRARLAQLRPDDAVLGEEGGASAGSTGLTWVIDPIDGTTNYLYDLPLYAVSVAVVTGAPPAPGWRPVAGAVVAAAWDVCWSAHLGGGARRQGPGDPAPVPIRVGEATDLRRALVGTGFGYRAEQRARQAEVLTRVLPRVRDIRRLGSAAVDLCLVADGRYDAYYETGLQPWDLAAGWLVVTEAGGMVLGPPAPGSTDPADATAATAATSASAEGNLTVAANPVLAPQLGDLLAH